jgi:hypothetical protein
MATTAKPFPLLRSCRLDRRIESKHVGLISNIVYDIDNLFNLFEKLSSLVMMASVSPAFSLASAVI